MKKNFTTPPNGAGMLTELTGLDLKSDVYPSKSVFQKRPIFIDNCRECKPFNQPQMNIKLNAEGDNGGGGLDINSLITTGASIFGDIQETRQLQLSQGIQQQQTAQAQAQAAAAAAAARAAETRAATVKAYALPIAIAGVVVIGGIAAYFMFKKKS